MSVTGLLQVRWYSGSISPSPDAEDNLALEDHQKPFSVDLADNSARSLRQQPPPQWRMLHPRR